jgi:hypothetical protein
LILFVKYDISASRISFDLGSLEIAKVIGPSVIADVEVMEKLSGRAIRSTPDKLPVGSIYVRSRNIRFERSHKYVAWCGQALLVDTHIE